MNENRDDDRIARLIDTGADLDPNLVAAYVDGGLLPAERLALERRLAADPEAQLLARTIQERPQRTGLWVPMAAIAATVLVGLLVWAKRDRGNVESLDQRLATVVASLRTGGQGFADFALLSDDELKTTAGVTRGAGALLYPAGVLLAPPTTLRWRNAEGSLQAEVTVRGPAVNWTQTVEGTEVAAPALGPGRFVVTLRAVDVLAGQSSRRSFVVADASERDRVEQAIGVIRAKASDDIEDLVLAHYALREHLYDVARDAAGRAAKQDGDVRAAAQRVLHHIEAIQGS